MLTIRANVKTEEILLPMGIYLRKYDERFDTCVVKAMDGNDEENITEKKIRNNGAKMITKLLGRKIIKVGPYDYPNGIGENTARQMFTEDRDTCVVAIRKLMGNEMDVKTKCSTCGEEYTGTVLMSDLINNIKKWDECEFYDETLQMGEINFELPDGLIVCDSDSGKEIICKKGNLMMPDGIIEETIMQRRESSPGRINSIMLSLCIKEIENIKKVDQDVVQAMSRVDREYLTEIIERCKCGPNLVVDLTCDICDNDFKFMLQLPYFFTGGRNQNS